MTVSDSAAAARAVTSELSVDRAVTFPGTILASVEFGRGLVTWPGDRDPIKIGLVSDVSAAEYDAAKGRLAVTLSDYTGDGLALHIGNLGDLRFVASGVTGFAWHPTDPNAIAWVEESEDGFLLVTAAVSDGVVAPTQIAVLPDRVRPVGWGSWGYALAGDNGLTTVAPSGAIIANRRSSICCSGE